MKKIIMQGIHFIGLSGIGWIIDFSIYAMLDVISKRLFVNNIISSWAGVTFVFIFATRKIFQNNSNISLQWKYIIYIFYQCVLIFFISRLLSHINNIVLLKLSFSPIRNFSGIISKILVTPVTMILNFFVMRGVIEKL